MNLKVNEIFYSLQGEGGRQGEASIFIRLSGCNLKCDFCDTDFESGEEMSLEQVLSFIRPFPATWIVWTGGEPTLQLNDAILSVFKEKGYRQAIESNGLRKLSDYLDYKVVSPKENPDYARKINTEVNEIRLPVRNGDQLPAIDSLPFAEYYFLSPVFSADEKETSMNIAYCVDYIKKYPKWRLSLQIHKLIGIE